VFWPRRFYLRTMSFLRSAETSRSDQTPAVRDGNSAVTRLVRFAARMLLWGCVLLLIVRGIISEFNPGPHVVTTTRGVSGAMSIPASAPVTTTSNGSAPASRAQSPKGK
jgi:hypothetical protein